MWRSARRQAQKNCHGIPSFGVVAPAVGPWQRRLLELGGVRPLAFGQYGEWGAGFEELVRDIAEVGQEEAADRYMLASREAAVGIQRRCIRQRITCAVLRAQADVLLGRMKYALPGWAQAEARREGQAEAHCAAQAQAENSGGVLGGRWRRRCWWWCTRGPRPGLESSPSRSPRPRPKWRRAAERVGDVLFAGGGVLLR